MNKEGMLLDIKCTPTYNRYFLKHAIIVCITAGDDIVIREKRSTKSQSERDCGLKKTY